MENQAAVQRPDPKKKSLSTSKYPSIRPKRSRSAARSHTARGTCNRVHRLCLISSWVRGLSSNGTGMYAKGLRPGAADPPQAQRSGPVARAVPRGRRDESTERVARPTALRRTAVGGSLRFAQSTGIGVQKKGSYSVN